MGFLVFRGVPSNTLNFRGNHEGSSPFLRVPLDFFISDVFGGAPKFSEGLYHAFCARWLGGSVPIFLVVSVLVAGFLITPTKLSLWCSCVIILVPFFPLLKGIHLFLEWLLHYAKGCPGGSSLCLLVLTYLDNEYIMGRYSVLSKGVFCRLSSYIF